MYNFQHQTNYKFYFYGSIYQEIKRVLFVVVALLTLFISTLFSFEQYQNHNNNKMEIEKNRQLELKEIITQSIIKNIQAQTELISINDRDIKHIVSKVIHKIEISPKQISYTTEQGE